ncbi:unnamed protein product [marine sediment metagenome]|uniref:Uncharacterized protein n=1 Tax=marine sediment metagenome TaxID=412755 RepID=X1SHT6_9ZZZZ
MPGLSRVEKQKIISGRKAVEAYRTAHTALHREPWRKKIPEEHTPLLNAMLKALKAQGFNSQEEFRAANEELCYREVARCYQYFGECDECAGRSRGCFESCHLPEVAEDTEKGRPFFPRRQAFYDWQHFEEHKPPTCSLSFRQIAEPTFDIYWGMPEGIKPEAYQRLRRREDK